MISSASALYLASALVSVADTTAPSAAALQVRALLARRWGVAETTVVLSWGQWPTDTARFARAKASFPGSADREGWMAVVFAPDSGSPASVRLRAGVLAPVLVAAHVIQPGKALQGEDFAVGERVVWGGGVSATPANPIGSEVRHTLQPGEPLVASNIIAPIGVRAGEVIRLLWERGQVRIEIEAIATSQARVGETVRARKGTVQYTGIITSPGMARLEGTSS